MSTANYIFTETQYAQELERLQAIEKIFDPTSHQRLQSTGITTNWRCLEVGAGAGSITQWMAGAVGESGQVVAVDLDTRFVANLESSNVEVLEGDIQHLPLEKHSFDLVHARYVLVHNPDAHAVLSRLLDLVKPGGWIVLEEPDFAAARAIAGEDSACQSVNNVNRAIEQMFTARGMDYGLGAKLPALLQPYDLQSFSVEVDTHLSQGGSGIATMMAMSTVQLAEKYIATGAVTQADIDHYGRFAEDPNAWAIYYATVGVIAQKLQA
ncbi:methyltransferase domain-containing protein [Acaryochloris sp. 'Moss Beach']|uniref:class I SAM-dependent methyltransferase n=1 Tax=Acaryochloris sp. 'Moss Beach' TaxID=2740837 RepID=UPI001F2D71E9|nr:class I SAM-dependent methyltransferase [Acaryochloris sp. 'Moss Beach']UJB71390.1 methyltransferase domain-containing protein [Acaryochloris sp. 'Moss Beach']